jgi:hypothetical protein
MIIDITGEEEHCPQKPHKGRSWKLRLSRSLVSNALGTKRVEVSLFRTDVVLV